MASSGGHDHRYNPWFHAGRMNLQIKIRELPIGLRGCWHQPTRTIVLDRGLTQVERRCTLSHELVHAERRDTGQCASSWHEDKMEQLVHSIAARRLITVPELSLAYLLHEHEHDQAEELWVDIPMLRARVACLTAAERDFIVGRGLGA